MPPGSCCISVDAISRPRVGLLTASALRKRCAGFPALTGGSFASGDPRPAAKRIKRINAATASLQHATTSNSEAAVSPSPSAPQVPSDVAGATPQPVRVARQCAAGLFASPRRWPSPQPYSRLPKDLSQAGLQEQAEESRNQQALRQFHQAAADRVFSRRQLLPKQAAR